MVSMGIHRFFIRILFTPFFYIRILFIRITSLIFGGKIFGEIGEDHAFRLCVLMEMIQHFKRNILSP